MSFSIVYLYCIDHSVRAKLYIAHLSFISGSSDFRQNVTLLKLKVKLYDLETQNIRSLNWNYTILKIEAYDPKMGVNDFKIEIIRFLN